MIAREKGKGKAISIKISGKSARQLIAIRSERERRTGKITTMSELVREAIEMLNGERDGSDESHKSIRGEKEKWMRKKKK